MTSSTRTRTSLMFVNTVVMMAVLLCLPRMVLAVGPLGPDDLSGLETTVLAPGRFVVRYIGDHPSSELMSALGNLQYEGLASIIGGSRSQRGIAIATSPMDAASLRGLPGVAAVDPIDFGSPAAPAQSPSVTHQPAATSATGAISGTVTAKATGTPISDASIWLFSATTYSSIGWSQMPNENGVYTFADLPAGTYKLWAGVSEPYADQWYRDRFSWYTADVVAVADGETTVVDFQLAAAGTVTGTVTAVDDGSPLSGVRVQVRIYEGNSSIGYTALTDDTGQYRVGGLKSGPCRVCFTDDAGVYVSECYDDVAYDWYVADDLVIAEGETLSSIDAALASGGNLVGTVSGADTAVGLASASVGLYTPGGQRLTSTTTDAAGGYSFGGLEPGVYKLRFVDADGLYLPMYYPNGITAPEASIVTVTAKLTTTVDMVLSRAGSIAGQVTDAATGLGVREVEVVATQLDRDGLPAYEMSVETDAGGNYTLSGLWSGVYSVQFDAPAPYLGETYDNLAYEAGASARPVVVEAPAATIGIDVALDKGYMITGTISASGSPVSGVEVRVFAGTNTWSSWEISDYSASDGTYAVGPLSSGDYRLLYLPPSSSPYALQWHLGASTYASATPVTGPQAGPLDVTLVGGSRISGKIVDGSEAPLSDAYAFFYEAGARTYYASAATGPDGVYVSPALPAGSYQVRFTDSSWSVSQWYEGVSDQDHSPVIVLDGTGPTSDIGAVLDLTGETSGAGTITGQILAADTGHQVGASICRYEDNPSDMMCGGWGQYGAFTMTGVSAGDHYLYYDAPIPYAPVFYHDASSPEAATAIAVVAGETTANIDQVLQVGGVVTGAATFAGVGVPGTRVVFSPADEMQITAVTGGPGSWERFRTRMTYAGAGGAYRMAGLPAGSYEVTFYPPVPYLQQSYSALQQLRGVQTVDATPVQVTLGQVVPDIGVALAEGGVIQGAITVVGSGAPLGDVPVLIYDATGSLVAQVIADKGGLYTSPGLPAAEYRLLFQGPTSRYLSEWNGDADSFEAAPAVPVSTPGAVVTVNAALAEGGTFSGYVRDASTDFPLPSATIWVYAADGSTLLASAYANAFGYYQTVGLRAGAYKAAFGRSGYGTRWYDDAGTIATAAPITVLSGENTGGVDVALTPSQLVFLPLTLRQ